MIIEMFDIPIYMIQISNNPISQHWKNKVLPSWKKHGYEVNELEAIVPDDIFYRMIVPNFKFKTKRNGPKEFTPTEKAVWFSHYYAWNLCTFLDKPIIIIEHDILLRKLLPNFVTPIQFFGFTMVKNTYKILPAGGYYIEPSAANTLIELAKKNDITMNVDGFIYDIARRVDKRITSDTPFIAEQIFDPKIGTTIDHGKGK